MTCACGSDALVRYRRHGDLCETNYCGGCAANGLRDVPAIRYSMEYGDE